MAIVVQKYGGTSVASIERMKKVARRVIKTKSTGDEVVVVLSAMAGETDRLISLARETSDDPDPRELDVLLSTGEQVSVALFAMLLNSMGCNAKSFLAHQVKIFTNRAHGTARIHGIDTERIIDEVRKGTIVVIAGFQGTTKTGDVTTLGRGGSDTTAVAVAAALNAYLCEIFTDVEGVYTADPNVCPKASKLKRISYDEMLELASLGAKVLQIRSVEFAKKYDIPIHVRSSLVEEGGTMVVREDKDMEKVVVSGVAYDKNQARITITEVPDKPGIASKLFESITDAGIIVDMILQNTSAYGFTDITFTVERAVFRKAMKLVRKVAKDVGAKRVLGDEGIAKVSIVGVGMRSHAGVASKMFTTLANENINIMMISTSEIKISCVIHEKYTELAVRALHDAFGL
jgi:aspartate kinase